MAEMYTEDITQIDINQEMKDAYLQYSMSVIVGRALPDVRDGLKPVHRRILFAMSELKNTYDKAYKKSARVVGDVIGKYHPHGDKAVYDTMVRMAQEFSMKEILVDGQGNFGSIDGDSPAAARYTEVRMTKLAQLLLEDINKETVDFAPNYDDSLLVPAVLPAQYPNLLVNGSSGIAVGMATNIPTHNLGEVVDACLHFINNPDCTLSDLIQIIPGPDFPTAATISGRKGILDAYRTGRGIIKLKAVAEIEELKDHCNIIVTELPYQVNKAKLIISMADLVKDKKIEGIADLRDESSREGIRILVKLRRNANPQVILNQLFKYTKMQTSFGIIMLALDSRNQPRVFNLKGIIESFVEHRRDVITRRCIFDLKKAQAREHILLGLQIALDHIDKIIKTIRAAKETKEAKLGLIKEFDFSDRQAQAILEMKLQRLTGLEREKIANELKEVRESIEYFKKVLGDVSEVYRIISEELIEIKEKFATPRKTQLVEAQEDIDIEDMIPKEKTIVTLTHSGTIKRIATESYKLQKRGGKGLKGGGAKDEDFVSEVFLTETHSTLLVFSDKGKCYWVKVYKIPKSTRTGKGKSIRNVIQVDGNENVQSVLPVEAYSDDQFLAFVSKNGIIKRTSLSQFSNPRTSGLIATKIDLDDEISNVSLTGGDQEIFLTTRNGLSIRFDENDVRVMGRTARGVKGINLGKDDYVVGCDVIKKDDDRTVLIITEKGYGKKAKLAEYRTQTRGGMGVITQKVSDKVGKLATARLVEETDHVVIMTNMGQSIRMKASGISTLSRNTQGVKLISLNEGEFVTSCALVKDHDEDEHEDHSDD